MLSATDAENLAMLQTLRRQPAYRLNLIYCASQAPLAMALSVEADQPADLSWADASHTQLQQQVVNWRNALRPAGVGGIDWQSWSDCPRSR